MKKPDSLQGHETAKVYLIAAILFLIVMTISYLTWFA
jgi:hypothetical protein